MAREQLKLPFGPLRNSNLFSNHWLDNRLPLEPEGTELRAEAQGVLNVLEQLWDRQRDRVEKYGDEQGLEEAFIQPVLDALGWKLKYQTLLRGRKPDYALFMDDASLDAALKAGRQSPDFWKHATIVADAKAWSVSLDRPISGGKAREYPPQQMEWYVNESQVPFGILTNGRLWRLIPRQHDAHQPRFETYLEFDLAKLLDLASGRRSSETGAPGGLFGPLEFFLEFYLFFSPAGMRTVAARVPLVERAVKGSSEYRLGVGEGLKDRVFEALRICIEGFLSHAPNALDPQADMAACRANSFTLLYRLLFIMYAEDRGLLPYGINRSYTDNRSLRRHRDDVVEVLTRVSLHGEHADYQKGSTAIWGDLKSLFDLIDRGRDTSGVPAYNGGLFDPGNHPFLNTKAIPDWHLARVIDQLGRAVDKDNPQAWLSRVDYRDLAIQHLGSIYEGLLELHPNYAVDPMVVIRREGRDGGEEKTQPARDEVPRGFEVVQTYKPGDVYLLNKKGERRASGSYYTPNHIVDYIVEKTLAPICRQVSHDLIGEIEQAKADLKGARNSRRQAIQERLDSLENDFDDRILALRVCDPAMGSGHFLLRVCQYLAEEVATNPNTGDPSADQLASDESTLTYWKRRIVEHCIYGVDLNPVAVELAKLALWLETVAIDQPLTFLDHHLRCGNSLVGADVEAMGALPGAHADGRNMFAAQVQARLPILLEPLAQIAATPSEKVAQVEQKEKLYRQNFERVRRPFMTIADLWCGSCFVPRDRQPTAALYQSALDALTAPKKLGEIANGWSLAAIAAARAGAVNAFHWQLEFPEAFFDNTGLRDGGGFDAIVGNPPYDVLSDKETGLDLSALKSFLKAQPVFAPSFRGKNNLYKLFICQAMSLLADGGRLGFITPMAILGDDQAADLRRMILTAGAFTSIDAFPQEDDPDRRVFPEAKMCTAVFTVSKNPDPGVREAPFISRRNPANVIDLAAPSLRIKNTEIGLYDPANLTTISCDQQDWDLATRIVGVGRMTRLGQHVQFFQGEVNETNARKDGCLLPPGSGGKLVTRGACVCLYVTRQASQGTDLYLNVPAFLQDKPPTSKPWHHKHARVVLQELASRSNVRRVIAARLAAGEFCNHTINYVPEHLSNLDLDLLLGILGSRLSEWYFRLGSTNAHISQYQLANLPCPAFADKATAADGKMLGTVRAVLDAWAGGAGRKADPADPEEMIREVCRILQPAMAVPPYGQAVRDTIVDLVKRITAIEAARGEIARAARSALAPAAQPYQDLIDRLLYTLAGMSESEWQGLEDRLTRML